MNERGRLRPPWWAWPSLLGIDAPVVAVAWAAALAGAAGASFGAAEAIALAGATGAAYLLDRARDARRLDGIRAPTLRHAFAARHPRFTLTSAGIYAVVALAALPSLTPATLVMGGGVAVATAVVLIAARGGRGTGRGDGRPLSLWRPWAVGAIFAGGVAAPSAAAGVETLASLGPALVGLALVAGMNVAMIAAWEARLDDGAAPADGRPDRSAVRRVLVSLALALGLTIGRPHLSGLGPALIVATLGLAVLDSASRIPSEIRHVAADAVLVVALAALPFA